MTELKTIKDFIVETDIGNVISPFEIKQEAINWIKAVSKEVEIHLKSDNKGVKTFKQKQIWIYFPDPNGWNLILERDGTWRID